MLPPAKNLLNDMMRHAFMALNIALIATTGTTVYSADSAVKHVQEAIKLANVNDVHASLEECNIALRLDPKCAEAYDQRGLIYFNLKRMPEALDDFSKAILFNKKLASAYFNRASTYRQARDFRSALPDLEMARDLEPKNAQYWLCLAKCYKDLNRPNAETLHQSLQAFNKAIELGARTPHSYYSRASVLRALGRNQEAIADYSEAMRLTPSDKSGPGRFPQNGTIGQFQRAELYFDTGQFKNARNDYDKIVAMRPKDANALMDRGEANYHLGEFDKAVSDFSRALSISSFYSDIYYSRALCRLCLGQNRESAEDLKKWLELLYWQDNGAVKGVSLYCMAMQRMNKKDECRKMIDSAAQHIQGQSWPATMLGLLQEKSTADAVLSTVSSHDRKRTFEAMSLVGLHLVSTGRTEAGKKILEKAIASKLTTEPLYPLVTCELQRLRP